jgi:uridine kinase
MPGALETLVQLRDAGVSIGLASNCGRGYLEHMLRALPLGEHVTAARCLDSPGVQDKSGMLGQLLEQFGTRSAVMVGDRRTDAEAARANGLPHVHLASGLAPEGETVDCEARIDVLAELLPRLSRRDAWIEESLERLGILRSAQPVSGGTRSIAITGRSAAGKSLFARDLARIAAARGRPAAVVSLEAYQRDGASSDAEPAHDGDPLGNAFDVERLTKDLLEPHRTGAVARTIDGTPLPPDALLVLEGLFLLHPRVRLFLDRAIYLEVDEATSLRRIAARDATEALVTARRVWLPAQRAFDASFEPKSRADLVLDAENPLGPPGS